jgi:hypothetical protein
MFELRRGPCACGHGGNVAAHARLDVLLHLIERYIHTLPVRLPHAVIAAYQRRKTYALGCAERGIPSCPVFHGLNRFARVGDVFARRLMPYQLFACMGMLAFSQS